MDIRIKSTDYDITPEVSRYLEGRTASIEKLLADQAVHARLEIEVGRDAGRHREKRAHIRFIRKGGAILKRIMRFGEE